MSKIKKKRRRAYAWVDLETTSLDPATGTVLEAALVITTTDLEVIGEPYSVLVVPGPNFHLTKLDNAVAKMHAKSGLLREIVDLMSDLGSRGEDSMVKNGAAASLNQVANTLGNRFMALHEEGFDIHLAGRSPHFDRAWIKSRWPLVDRLLSHRLMDVSAVRMLVEDKLPDAVAYRYSDVKHRALQDCLDSIEELRTYRSLLSEPKELEDEKDA